MTIGGTKAISYAAPKLPNAAQPRVLKSRLKARALTLGLAIPLAAVLALAVMGCQKSRGAANPPTGSSTHAYEVVTDLKTLPLSIQQSIELLKHSRGATFFKEDPPSEFYTVVVGLGPRPTSGYSVTVQSVQAASNLTTVVVEEKAPTGAANDVITYPLVVFRQARKIEQLEAKDSKGNAFPLLGIGSGAYTGRIDNNSVEINTARGLSGSRKS